LSTENESKSGAIFDGLVRKHEPFTIIGGNGFIGSHLAATLTQRGINVVRPADIAEAVRMKHHGHVIYCAGLTADYSSRPFDTVEAHVSSFARLLQAVSCESIVYLSSTRLYDQSPFGSREDASLALDPRNQRHLYDLSKALGEWLCINRTDGRGRVARLSSVYAADLSSDNFLHGLIRSALSRSELRADTDPETSRDYIDIDDVCALLVAIAVRGAKPIYNLASGENVTNQQVIDLLNLLTKSRLLAGGSSHAAASPVIDISAITKEFGFRPQRVLDRLPDIVARHRAAHD
jgi:nucleoside-diphosphate-sugar epimerase